MLPAAGRRTGSADADGSLSASVLMRSVSYADSRVGRDVGAFRGADQFSTTVVPPMVSGP